MLYVLCTFISKIHYADTHNAVHRLIQILLSERMNFNLNKWLHTNLLLDACKDYHYHLCYFHVIYYLAFAFLYSNYFVIFYIIHCFSFQGSYSNHLCYLLYHLLFFISILEFKQNCDPNNQHYTHT